MINVTESAINQIRTLLSSRAEKPIGIRVGVKNSGCSGLSYLIEFVDVKSVDDETAYESNEFSVFVDPRAVMYLAGTEMDFVNSPMKSGFVFNNPNQKGGCGCGKSFRV